MNTVKEIAIVMGSQNDWSVMQESKKILDRFKVASETKIISAHRTPKRLYDFANNAQSNAIKVIIAGAGGAAHLPGMLASMTTLPVLGIPINSGDLNGWDSLLSIVQMPAGIPVPTLAIGKAGAKNAALSAISILALTNANLHAELVRWRKAETDRVSLDPQRTENP